MSSDTKPKASSINLFYTEGSSDKVYQIQLEEKDGGWIVNFQNGRRGSTLRSGTKTAKPVSFEVASKAYNKILKEKMKKGYTPDTSGSIYQSSQDIDNALGERFTGVIPQLLNSVRKNEDIEKIIQSSEFIAQEKHDGERRSISFDGENVIGANRDGLAVALPLCIAKDIKSQNETFVLDGEIMGERFVAFDIVEHNGKCIRKSSVLDRLKVLEKVASSFSNVEMVKSYESEEEKRDLIKRLNARRAEGVVFKKKTAPYVSGRPASGGNQLKWKFVESATLKVSSIHKTKRSVGLEAVDGGEVIHMGNCTVPTNYDMPKVGDLVEVEYLYLYRNGSLYQPQFKGVRSDKSTPDELSTFKLKADTYVDSPDDLGGGPSKEKSSSKMKI